MEFNLRRFHGTPDVHPQAGLPRIFAPSVPFDPFAERDNFLISQGLWGLNLGDVSAETIRGIAANPKGAAAQIEQLNQ